MLWNRLEVKDVIGLHLTMRTDMKTGLLFFTYGGPGLYFYLGMINGALHMQFSNNVATGSVTFSRSDISLCDGYWHTIAVKKTNQQAEITINSITVSNGDSNFSLKVETVSPVFIGGIPDNSEATQFVKDNGLTLPFVGESIVMQGEIYIEIAMKIIIQLFYYDFSYWKPERKKLDLKIIRLG